MEKFLLSLRVSDRVIEGGVGISVFNVLCFAGRESVQRGHFRDHVANGRGAEQVETISTEPIVVEFDHLNGGDKLIKIDFRVILL